MYYCTLLTKLDIMKIYKITQEESVEFYDCYFGHIIIANNKREVRKLAKEESADEGENVWNTAQITIEGEYAGKNKEPFILLSDFNAG